MRSSSAASLALATTGGLCAGEDVVFGELVTVLAMRPSSVACRDSFAAQGVLAMRHRVQVPWIAARPVSAQVV
jgi:hypothetical protein